MYSTNFLRKNGAPGAIPTRNYERPVEGPARLLWFVPLAFNYAYRYVNANVKTARRAAAALDAFNDEATEAAPPAELVH